MRQRNPRIPTYWLILLLLTNPVWAFHSLAQMDQARGSAAPLADVSKLSFGDVGGGIRLGLAVWVAGNGNESRLKGQIELWNATTQALTFPKGGAFAFELRISDKSGRMVPLWNRDDGLVFIHRRLPALLTQKLEPDARQAASFDLSNLAKFPAPGQYFFSAMMYLHTQAATNAVEGVELLSGAVEFNVPLVTMSLTNPIPRRTNGSLLDMSQDPASAKTEKERASIQKWNEALTNTVRTLWLSNAALGHHSPAGAPASKSPDISLPLAEVGPVVDGGSRWWLAGVAAACAAGIGFIILRRRRSGPQG